MRASTILLALPLAVAAQTTGKLGDAKVVNDNPVNAAYKAEFKSAKNTVRGSVHAVSEPSGTGVKFTVNLSGLPHAGPWNFHLHDQPVPADGNCTATLAHLDPTQRGQTPACDKSAPQTCEVGDLSGKHGALTGPSASVTFVDKYASLKQGLGAFFGNRSIVIHWSNSSRLACANFAPVAASEETCGPVVTVTKTLTASSTAKPVPTSFPAGNGTVTPIPTGGVTVPVVPTASPTPPPYVPGNGAEKVVGSLSAILGAVAVAFML